MKKKQKQILLVITAAVIVATGTVLLSCQRNKEKPNSVTLGKTDSTMLLLKHQMEDLYRKVNKADISFDTCLVFRQSDGHTIAMATVTSADGGMTGFAAPTNPEGTEIKYIGELPASVCTFSGLQIEDCLPPTYNGEYGWDFKTDKPSLLNNPTFRKSITAYKP